MSPVSHPGSPASRPRPALVVYGSLMHPDELTRHVAGRPPLAAVRVSGFRRSFCQEPSWRSGEDERRGVLTVRPSPGDWICGVLLADCDAALLRSLDHRERGYERVRISASSISRYGAATEGLGIREACLYRGRAELFCPGLLPNPDYLALCIAAAGRWGEAFLEDFLASTYVGDRTLLELGYRHGHWPDG